MGVPGEQQERAGLAPDPYGDGTAASALGLTVAPPGRTPPAPSRGTHDGGPTWHPRAVTHRGGRPDDDSGTGVPAPPDARPAAAGRGRHSLADVLPALLRALGEPGPTGQTGAGHRPGPGGGAAAGRRAGHAAAARARRRRPVPGRPAGRRARCAPGSRPARRSAWPRWAPGCRRARTGWSGSPSGPAPGSCWTACTGPATGPGQQRDLRERFPPEVAAAAADALRAGGGRRHHGAGRVAAGLRRVRADPGGAARRRVPRHPGPRRPGRGDHRRGHRAGAPALLRLPRRSRLDRAPARPGLDGLAAAAGPGGPAGRADRRAPAVRRGAGHHRRPRHGARETKLRRRHRRGPARRGGAARRRPARPARLHRARCDRRRAGRLAGHARRARLGGAAASRR